MSKSSSAGSRARGSRTSRKSAPSRGGPSVLTWVLLGAIALLIGGIGLVKWADSDKGQATLLTLGASSAFGEVQQAVEQVLVQTFPDFRPGPGAADRPLDHDQPAPQLGPAAAVRCRLVAIAPGTPFAAVQLDLDRRLRRIGAHVLWAQRLFPDKPAPEQRQPSENLDALRLDVGVDGKPTHTLVLHRRGHAPQMRWGDGFHSPLWEQLRDAARGRPVVALVLDDWGGSPSDATRHLLSLPIPFTMAVLPRLAHSRHFALEATDLVLPDPVSGPAEASATGELSGRQRRLEAGCFVELRMGAQDPQVPARRREIILHQPMQPQDYPEANPGADPILVGMDAAAIGGILDVNLTNVPGVRGISNHMGSAATSDETTMAALMAVLRERGLFFFDSLTTSRSVAYDLARREGLPALRNRIFLDHARDDEEVIAANLDVAVRSARSEGFAVAIGHPRPATARVLARRIPELQAAGVVFVTLSEMLALRQSASGERNADGT